MDSNSPPAAAAGGSQQWLIDGPACLSEAAFALQRTFAIALVWAGLIGRSGSMLAEPMDAARRVEGGPLWQEFPLVWSPGWGREIFGPVWGQEQNENQTLWRLSPLLSHVEDPATERSEYEFLYPLFTFDRFGTERRIQFMQLFSISGGGTVNGETKRRETIFPIYFRQKSDNPTNDYFALVPFYGHLRNRLFRDEVRFALMPFWLQTRKRDIITDNYLVPFFHVRRGNHLTGWQFWPVFGQEHKEVTSKTNSLDEMEIVGGHDKSFAFWPLFLKSREGIGTTNPVTNQAVFPLVTVQRSPLRDNTTILWPLFTRTENREQHFVEWGLFFPFIGWARGEGKHADRLWPLYGNATNATTRRNFFLYPLYTHRRVQSAPLDSERTRVLFFGYNDFRMQNTTTGKTFHRRDLWPLFTWRQELDGRARLQVLAPIEPLLPNNKSIERLYSPLVSIWRSEANPKDHKASQSLLWNLWRREVSPKKTRTSTLFGLIRTERNSTGRKWRFLGMPFPGRASGFPNAAKRNGAEDSSSGQIRSLRDETHATYGATSGGSFLISSPPLSGVLPPP